jgi:hemoglobin
MDAEPEFAGIRKLHRADLGPAREKLYLFLSGWLGGPQLYAEKFGHPMLRARHLPFAIGEAERDLWLACMTRAMKEIGVEEALRAQLLAAFFKTADWMRNQEG